MNHPDRPFGDRRWYGLSTVYVLDRTLDQLKTEPGRTSTDPYEEELYWSGLGYSLDFSWKNLGHVGKYLGTAVTCYETNH